MNQMRICDLFKRRTHAKHDKLRLNSIDHGDQQQQQMLLIPLVAADCFDMSSTEHDES